MDFSKDIKNRNFWLPLIIVVSFIIINLITLQQEPLKYYNLSRNLSQWDGQHYTSIAQNGYQIEECHPAYPAGYICGNVGWFPFYPMTAKLFTWLPLNANWILILLSWLFLTAACFILFNLLKQKFSETTSIISLVLLFCFPTSFYYLTAFPYSLFLLLTIVVFWMLENDDYKYLFIVTALLTITYPSGIVITLPLLYLLVKNYKRNSFKSNLALSSGIIAPGAALFIFALYYYFKFDNFFLYTDFQSQNYFDHHISFPLIVIFKNLFINLNQFWTDFRSLSEFSIGRYNIELRYVPVWISLLFILVFIPLFYTKKIPVTWQIFMFGIFLFTPTFGTVDCYYRHIVVAFPFFVMGGLIYESKRKYLLLPYLIIAIYLGYFFYQPLYRVSQLM